MKSFVCQNAEMKIGIEIEDKKKKQLLNLKFFHDIFLKQNTLIELKKILYTLFLNIIKNNRADNLIMTYDLNQVTALFSALYADIFMTKGFFIPCNLKKCLNIDFLGDLTLPCDSSYALTNVTRIDAKYKKVDTNKLFIFFNFDIEYPNSHSFVSNIVVRNTDKYVNSINVSHLYSAFNCKHAINNVINNEDKNFTISMQAQNMEQNGSVIMKVVRDSNNLVTYSSLFSSYYINPNPSDIVFGGGVLYNLKNQFKTLTDIMTNPNSVTDEKLCNTFDIEPAQFKGTIIFCESKAKQSFKQYLSKAGFCVYQYRRSLCGQSSIIRNSNESVILISFLQLQTAEQELYEMNVFPFVVQLINEQNPTSANNNSTESNVSLYFLISHRIVVSDMISLNTRCFQLLKQMKSRLRWIFCHRKFPLLSDFSLFSSLLKCTNNYYIFNVLDSESITCLKDSDSCKQRCEQIDFSLTKHGLLHLKKIQAQNDFFQVTVKKLINEITNDAELIDSKKVSMSMQKTIEPCPICYESLSDQRAFYQLKCNKLHKICQACGLQIKQKSNSIKCPMCRSKNKFPEHIRLLGCNKEKKVPMTTKMDFIYVLLKNYKFIAVTCQSKRHRLHLIKLIRDSNYAQDLKRVSFITQKQASMNIEVPYEVVLYFTTGITSSQSETISATSLQKHDASKNLFNGELVKSIYFNAVQSVIRLLTA